MSKHNGFGPGYFCMLEKARLMQTHEAVVDLIHGRPTPAFNILGYNQSFGLDYEDNFVDYEDLTDEDDDENGRQNNKYCGFAQNFLDKGIVRQLPAITHYKSVKSVTPEEAAKNAKELLDEEEKLKKKAEKKKQKKMRQRERRRLEKLEKDTGSKSGTNQAAATVPVKTKPMERECEEKKKTNNSVPPDPGPQYNSVASESSDSCDEEDEDKDSVVDELELDMNSCFVTNAAAIAKRKLEQKPKPDRKDQKTENSKKHDATQSTAQAQIKNINVKAASVEHVMDNVTKSMELAVLANKYAQTGNLDMAVKYFTDAIKHNPQEVKLFGNRSFCYEKMQQYEKALIDADIALSLNPTWIKGLYRKGKALVGLKKYYEAALIYKEVLKLNSSCADAAQELMRVQIMQLMDMGYTRDQSTNALIIHGTVEKALETLSGLQGNIGNVGAAQVHVSEIRGCPELNPQSAQVPLRTFPQIPPKVSIAVPATQELFPIWVGDLVSSITELKLHEIFSKFGTVHSVRLLSARRCAFVNYTNKEDCVKAIREMHGFRIAGTCLIVRYPDRIHTHLGVSRAAATDTGKVNMYADECRFWRTTGCIKSNRCTYRHVPENKGIDQPM